MSPTERIPDWTSRDFDGMLRWFSEMSVRDLLFHPEDDPSDVVRIADGTSSFTPEECEKLRGILNGMWSDHGDAVNEAAHPIFMKAAGIRLDA